MNTIVVRMSETAFAVAAALAKVTDAEVVSVPADISAEEFARALGDPDVLLGVMTRAHGPWVIAQHSAVPLVVVPPETSGDYALERVLVPLDGTEEAAQAISETVRLFCAAGVEITVLHVFDQNTAPAHWDQAAHARPAWEREFHARFCAPYLPASCHTVTLRSGTPGAHILDLAATHSDLIVLGWSQHLTEGRARTVRHTLSAAPVPVLLIPTTPA
ncbi:universal stress protein [Nocardia sp. CDC160]|uniref:universal stress protein n=1 Tax=Nocardia sp. CDC160 TaxID=3112166 RepID=UPI002DB9D355|nr:universal stress protein [Nocardia sp. CDC160]MEC3918702.1 universal stress protein [Nocardia sp. CDC160]